MRVFLLALALPLAAQWVLDPSNSEHASIMRAAQHVWDDTSTPKLPCSIQPQQPTLSYGLMLYAGYRSVFPMDAVLQGRPERLVLVTRVTPKGGQPVVLWDGPRLPRQPSYTTASKKVEVQTSGAFLVGAGEYRVELLATTDARRFCKKTWTIRAKDRNIPLAQKPGEVAPAFIERWRGLDSKQSSDGEPARVTLIVNVAPVYPRRHVIQLSGLDRSVLTNLVTTFLDRSRFTEARVLAIDIVRKKILFRADRFDSRQFREFSETLRTADLGTISWSTLRYGATEGAFMASLLREEADNPAQAEEVVFIGGTGMPVGRPAELRKRSDPDLKPYYLAIARPGMLVEDMVQHAVKSLGGRVIGISRPEDFGNAIRTVDRGR